MEGFGTPVPAGIRTRFSESCFIGTLIGGGCEVGYADGATSSPNANEFTGGEIFTPNGWAITASFPLTTDSGREHWICEVTCGVIGQGTGLLTGQDEFDEPFPGFYVETQRLAPGCTDTTVTAHAICLDTSGSCFEFLGDVCE